MHACVWVGGWAGWCVCVLLFFLTKRLNFLHAKSKTRIACWNVRTVGIPARSGHNTGVSKCMFMCVYVCVHMCACMCVWSGWVGVCMHACMHDAFVCTCVFRVVFTAKQLFQSA